MLLNYIKSDEYRSKLQLLSLSSISSNKKFQHSQGRRFWTGYKPSKALNFYKINETAAGVALVKAAAVGFTMHADHRLLEDEGGGPPA